jgi:hypothetical protein
VNVTEAPVNVEPGAGVVSVAADGVEHPVLAVKAVYV